MNKLLIPALIGGALVSPLSAAFQLVNISAPAGYSAADGPLVFNDVNGVVGCMVTVDFTGGSSATNLLSGGTFDNRVNGGTNTWTVTVNQLVDFQVLMTTNHGPDETNTLTVGGGTFDNASFTILNDAVGTGTLPTAFTAGDTNLVVSPYTTITPSTNGDHPEWSIDGTGSSFTFTQDSTGDRDGAASSNHRNSFQFYIDDATHAIPEPSSAVLLGLGGLALLARRRR